jgi:hypothetical protein
VGSEDTGRGRFAGAGGYRRNRMKKEKIVVHDELLAKVGVALRRAAKRAREIAAQTNTPIVVFANGKVVKKKVTKK